MQVRILSTQGQGNFVESAWTKPAITADQIEVKAVMTGVCRSDIDMMQGKFGPLPINMQGHEGLGIVMQTGANITDVSVGDYVATRGEPAYADFYNADASTYVKVPELHQRYIIEPVACGVNLVMACIREIAERSGPGKKLLIRGSGFLAYIAYRTLQLNHLEFEIDVLGSHNQKLWGDRLLFGTTATYDVIIDLTSEALYEHYSNNALIIVGTAKAQDVELDYGALLWRAATLMFPSPRNTGFHNCMRDAVRWIEQGDIVVDGFWTQGYHRDSAWLQAFEDGVNRPVDYSRGFIYWNGI